MNEKPKRTLAIIAFFAICGIAFSYFFINQGEKGSASTNEQPVKEEKSEKTNSEETSNVNESDKEEKVEKEKKTETTKLDPADGPYSIDQIPILRAYVVDDDNSLTFDATKNGWSESELFSVAQEEYMRGIGFSLKYEYYSQTGIPAIDFKFDNKFTSFIGKIGVDDSYSDSPVRYHLLFASEDRNGNRVPLYKSASVRGGDYPIDFEVDVTDVERLVIKVIREGDDDINLDTKIALIETEIQ